MPSLRSTTQLPRHAPPSLSLFSLGVATRLVRTKILTLLLVILFGAIGLGADSRPTAPQDSEAAQLEQHWQAIWPELFAGDASKKHIGARVRFRTGPFTQISAGPPVAIKCRSGETILVTNVPKSARVDIATPHKPPTIVTVEGVIATIDLSKKVVTIKSNKVDVTW